MTRLPLFEVDPEGFRELHSKRPAWRLAMEIVSNALDEPTATEVRVSLEKPGRYAVYVVEDNGAGFARIEDAWTLYAHTPKRLDIGLRGRFNVGEKTIMAVAARGSIETTSGTVEFDRRGRKVGRKARAQGTVVTLHMPWTKKQVAEVLAMLGRIIPNKTVTVNGSAIVKPEPMAQASARLKTVILTGDGMEEETRETEIAIYRAPEGQGGLLYELGVPVCESGTPFDISVGQKVPLGPDRESVSPGYLRDIWAEVLNATHSQLTDEQLMEPWAQSALADKRVPEQTVKEVKERIFPKTLLWSSDVEANERAREAGFAIAHPRTIAPEVRERLEDVGLQHTSDVFGTVPAVADPVKPTEAMERFAATVKRLGEALGVRVSTVRFYSLRGAYECASWSHGTVSFNVANLPGDFFDRFGAEQVSIVLHELAHGAGRGPNGEPHGVAFRKELERLAGLAVEIALLKPEIINQNAESL